MYCTVQFTISNNNLTRYFSLHQPRSCIYVPTLGRANYTITTQVYYQPIKLLSPTSNLSLKPVAFIIRWRYFGANQLNEAQALPPKNLTGARSPAFQGVREEKWPAAVVTRARIEFVGNSLDGETAWLHKHFQFFKIPNIPRWSVLPTERAIC